MPEHTPPFPRNWNQPSAWDRFFASFDRSAPWEGLCDLFHWLSIANRVSHMREGGVRKLWLPGCGASTLPWLYAACGFEVWASDVSRVAIRLQQTTARARVQKALNSGANNDDMPENQELCAEAVQRLPAIAGPEFVIHDCRTPFPEGNFDLVLNVLAYSGLGLVGKRRAARIFFSALRAGGWAKCEVLNEPVTRRRALEMPLREAGFFVVGDAETWFHVEQERRFGLSPRFFHPMEEQLKERAKDRLFGKWMLRRELGVLESLKQEYDRMGEREAADLEARRDDGHTRFAQVLYNTG